MKHLNVLKCLKKLPGLDGILNEMIRYYQRTLLPVLTKIFNNIMGTRNYPDMWTTAYITPIFQKGPREPPVS